MDPFKIAELLEEIREILSFTLKKVDLDNSDLARNIKVSFKNNTVVILIPTYAKYVDSGRKPGSPPPIDEILDFIKRKGIRASGVNREQLAFAISNSIGKKGIKAKPFLDELKNEVDKIVLNHITVQLKKQLTKIFN